MISRTLQNWNVYTVIFEKNSSIYHLLRQYKNCVPNSRVNIIQISFIKHDKFIVFLQSTTYELNFQNLIENEIYFRCVIDDWKSVNKTYLKIKLLYFQSKQIWLILCWWHYCEYLVNFTDESPVMTQKIEAIIQVCFINFNFLS